MYHARLITDPNTWERFVLAQPWTLFVQSPTYGTFYESLGESSYIIGLYDDDVLIGGSLVVTTHAKRGNFLYLPYGPILPFENAQAVAVFFDFLKTCAKEKRMDFIRASPFIDDTPEHRSLFAELGFRNSPMHILAETTWLLDITPDEDTLLAAMNKNHRNLIHRLLREGATTRILHTEQELSPFHQLLDETEKRHGFHRFKTSYIDAEFQAFADKNEAIGIEGYLPNHQLDAAAIVMLYGSMGCYRHGASRGLDKRLPASYLAQWRAIQEAKKRGMTWYNFWGIAEDGAKSSHPFFGITHFKKGFGGAMKSLLHCQDLPLRPRYMVNWAIESARRVVRGF